MDVKRGHLRISEEIDVAKASALAFEVAAAIGFKKSAQFMIATAASELARNIFKYALQGEMTLQEVRRGTQTGIEIIAEDDGPGIDDIGKAMQEHFSTGNSLGLGLPGTKRLMNEFSIDEKRTRGTKITVRKWV